MRVSQVDNLAVIDADGRRLGRVHELHVENGLVVELAYGRSGWIERLTGRAKPTVVPWSRVAEIGDEAIRLN